MTTKRTYWHLEALQRRPTDYEIATSRLLYHPGRGFEVHTPVGAWYTSHPTAVRCDDWERFADPRATTYAKYTELMRDKEIFVERLLAVSTRGIEPAWLDGLDRILGPLRYPVHGLQMVAAYAGSMAPSGRLAVSCLFQAADELRRVEQLSYRMRYLELQEPSFGRESRAIWENDAAWQPLRRAIEQLLVTYDWAEALVAMNGILKPVIDEIFLVQLAQRARAHGDDVLEKILLSLDEDARWHRSWFDAFARLLLEESANHEVLRAWRGRWEPRARAALEALEVLFDASDNGSGAWFATLTTELRAAAHERWSALGLAQEVLGEQRA